MSRHFPTATAPQRVQGAWHTSGLIQLTRPQMVGTLSGLMLSVLLASLDQTIVGTAEPRIIASLFRVQSLSVGLDRVFALFDDFCAHIRQAFRYLRAEMVPPRRLRRFRSSVYVMRSGRQ